MIPEETGPGSSPGLGPRQGAPPRPYPIIPAAGRATAIATPARRQLSRRRKLGGECSRGPARGRLRINGWPAVSLAGAAGHGRGGCLACLRLLAAGPGACRHEDADAALAERAPQKQRQQGRPKPLPRRACGRQGTLARWLRASGSSQAGPLARIIHTKHLCLPASIARLKTPSDPPEIQTGPARPPRKDNTLVPVELGRVQNIILGTQLGVKRSARLAVDCTLGRARSCPTQHPQPKAPNFQRQVALPSV
ncbi:hypothetical protein DFH27DRAFT_620918 [Peziza echinospora]|nr:hypothetical protein DFH27DRAFT_620918 [Peziza echinospora]